MTSDSRQLTAYATSRDGQALAGLVRGYGALVYSVCLRILRNLAAGAFAAGRFYLATAVVVALGLTVRLALMPHSAPSTGATAMTQPATARHEGTRVIIDGVPNHPMPLTWDQWLAGLQIMLEHRGEKVSMDELIALSGEAFGFCHADRWELRTMLSAANDPLSAAAATLGYDSAWMPTQFFWEVKKRPEADRKAISQQYLAAVRSQIDRNRTVLLGGTHGQCGAWRVVVGYDPTGNKVCLNGGTTPYEWTDWEDPKAASLALFDMQVRGHIRPQFHGGWLPNTAFYLKDKTTSPSPQQRAIATLRQAVALHKPAPFKATFYGNVTYHFGDDAFAALANDLRALDYPNDIINAQKIKGEFYDMAMLDGQIGLLMRTRPAAAAFCQHGAELFPAARTPLLQASEHYRAIATITRNAFAPFFEPPAPAEPVERKPRWRDLRLPVAAKAYLSSAENRGKLAAAVNQIADHERQAVALLQQALATLDSPSPAKVVTERDRIYLAPIPRFPRQVDRIDAAGQIISQEREPAWRDHLIGCLYVAMTMQGGQEFTWPEVFAASGHAFRFAIADDWAHDAEFATPIDEVAAACDILGFEHTAMGNRDLAATETAIELALQQGRPVLAGISPRFWLVIVGVDRAKREYLTIGGKPYRDWKPVRAKPGEPVAETLRPDETRRIPIPGSDWYAGVMAPQEVARNAIVIVGPRKPVDRQTSVTRTLAQAAEFAKTRRFDRPNLDIHRAFAKGGDFPNTPRPGQFVTGNEAIREFAGRLETVGTPTHDFGFIHAIDTTLGMQLRAAQTGTTYLAWAATQLEEPARGHVRKAADMFGRSTADEAILTTYVGYLPPGNDTLAQHIAAHPALVYIAAADQRDALTELGLSVKPCPWGLSVLPDQKTFGAAKAQAVARLREIADLRDQAAAEMRQAFAAATQPR